MILKDIDDKSPDLARLQELIDTHKLSSRQRDGILSQIDNIRTGWRGEKDAAYFFDEFFVGAERSVLIHDLRLEIGDRSAQIDHLIITKFRRAYVLETKNLNANLTCNADGEWTAWYGASKRGTPVPIASPIEQARRHVAFLHDWFHHSGLLSIKVIEPVVIVGSKTYVNKKRASGDSSVPILRADMFSRWWQNERLTGGENLAGLFWTIASAFSQDDLAAIGKHLVDSHRPIHFDWEARFGLAPLSALASSDGVSLIPQPSTDVLSSAVEAPPIAPASSALPLPVPSSETATVNCSAPASKDALSIGPAIPPEILTTLGMVNVRRVTDGRYALRHGEDAALAAFVQTLARPHGQWQPRFRNWLIPQASIQSVVDLLRSG